MTRHGEAVFVDSGAWIALALRRDSLHERAIEMWDRLLGSGARLHTSVPVVLETFTFLERNAARDVAILWKDSLREVRHFRVHDCRRTDLDKAWPWFDRRDLHKLSATDATSFVLMARLRIRWAFTFDQHFAAAGFRLVSA